MRRNGKAVWCGNSRAQEMQRLGRLFHSEYKGEHIVLMTVEEYVRYKKRLFGIYEKGFEIQIERGEGVPMNLSDLSPAISTDIVHREERLPAPRTQPNNREPRRELDTSKFPLLDERRKMDRQLIREILQSPFCMEQKGVPIRTIRAILDHNHIKYRDDNQVKHLVNAMFADFEIGGRTVSNARIYFMQEAGNK